MIIKKKISSILSSLNLHFLHEINFNVINSASNDKYFGLRIPFSSYVIVTKGVSEKENLILNDDLPKESLEEHNAYISKEVLNWKPDEDFKRTKVTAIDFRTYVTSNIYAKAYKNKSKAMTSISKGRSFWRLETMRQIRRSCPNIFKGSVMEIGAGTGIVSSTLSKFHEVSDIFCLDYDEYSVNFLMPLVQNSLNADSNKITRVLGSYNNIKLSSESLNTIVAVGAMHHSEDLDSTFQEAFRVLKPGGHFIISDYVLTDDLSRDEYDFLLNRPRSEEDAKKFNLKKTFEGIITNKSISEHARPLFVYKAAAFNSGFNVFSNVFDATNESGGYLSRIFRFIKSFKKLKKNTLFSLNKKDRVHGYDVFGNVKAFNMRPTLDYPVYAQNAPSFLKLLLFNGVGSKPVYDNLVLILVKPDAKDKKMSFHYRNGKIYNF